MKLIFTSIFFFTLLSCSKKEEVQNELEPYIISKTDRKLEEDLKRTGKVILVNIGFYCRNQIIIDQNQNIYYYPTYSDFPISDLFVEQIGKKRPIPYFINLSPNDFVKIQKNGLNTFLNEKVSKSKTLIVIGSQSDTIKNTEFLKFLKTIKSRFQYYKIRRTTQEEDTALHYKKTNKLYFPDSIKWDKTRIRLRN